MNIPQLVTETLMINHLHLSPNPVSARQKVLLTHWLIKSTTNLLLPHLT